MSFLYAIVGYLITVGVLVTWHELGHYLAAIACKVKVLRFSIGFGKPLLIKRIGKDQTEFVIGAIPLGGFVRMVDSRADEISVQERHRAFDQRPVWQRAVIVAAGPIANFVLAIAFLSALYVNGVPELKPMLSAPPALSPAAKAGFEHGDLVRAVNGKPVTGFSQMQTEMLSGFVSGDSVKVSVRDVVGVARERVISVPGDTAKNFDQDYFFCLGLRAYTPHRPASLGVIAKDSAAARAGLQVGDRINAVNGVATPNFFALADQIARAPQTNLSLDIDRDGQLLNIQATPAAAQSCGQRVGRLGIGPPAMKDLSWQDEMFGTRSYGPIEALEASINKVWSVVTLTARLLYKMVVGEASYKNLSGPITMADHAGQATKAGGQTLMEFLAMISIAIGFFNLLPLPVLDGGQLVMLSIEALRGRPLSDTVQLVAQRVGVACILALTFLALSNDLWRYLVQ
jgi:regulator of sigma E protease